MEEHLESFNEQNPNILETPIFPETKHPIEWYMDVLTKFATFSGRAGRAEYWNYFFINILIMFGIGYFKDSLTFHRLFFLSIILQY